MSGEAQGTGAGEHAVDQVDQVEAAAGAPGVAEVEELRRRLAALEERNAELEADADDEGDGKFVAVDGRRFADRRACIAHNEHHAHPDRPPLWVRDPADVKRDQVKRFA